MALFDEAHKKQMEENGRQLRKNLEKRIKEGSDGSVFGNIGLQFSQNLLHSLNTRKVKK